MRKRVWALAAALLMLLLTGCGSLLNRDYSVTEPHSSSYYESEDRSVLRAESYQDLVNALLVLISGGAKEGTIWLYPDDSGLPAPQAAERACLEVQKETPLGAYAVEYLTYTVDETPRNYDAIQLTVGYRRTARWPHSPPRCHLLPPAGQRAGQARCAPATQRPALPPPGPPAPAMLWGGARPAAAGCTPARRGAAPPSAAHPVPGQTSG